MRWQPSLLSRVVLALVLVLPAGLAFAPGAALAGSNPIRLTLFVGSECFSGWATSDSTVTYRWKDAAGNLKQQAEVPAPGGLWFSDCVEFTGPYIEPGDRFLVSDGHFTRRFTIPMLSIRLNRISDVVKGTAPAGTSLRLEYLAPAYPGFDVVLERTRLRVRDDGTWSRDLTTEGYDINGGDSAGIVWKSEQGDKVFMYASAPYVVVTIGRSAFSGLGNRYTTADLYVSDAPSSDPKGWDEIPLGVSELFSGTLRDGAAHPVPVEVGDFLTSNVAPDASFSVPDIQFTADAATDHVIGTCTDSDRVTQRVHIAVYRTGIERGYVYSGANPDGTFDQHMGPNNFPNPAVLKSGDRVLVRCFMVNGDIVQKWGDVL